MKVLRILTRPNLGGPMRQAVALWHAHRAMGVRTLLAVGRCEADEVALAPESTGIPLLGFGEALAAGDAVEGLCVVPGLGRSLSPLRDFRAGGALRRLIEAQRPEVVHSHTSKAGVLGRRAALAMKVPVVAHSFHGLVLRDYASLTWSMLARKVERRLAARSDLLFAVSESCRRELEELGVSRRVRVLPPAVDTAGFVVDRRAARDRLGLEDGCFAIGFVGRMVPIKRPQDFVTLVEALPAEVVGSMFGEGPELEQLRRHAGDRLRLYGAVTDLAPLLAGLDLLVLTSRREGFPVAGVEAAAAGVPALGYDVPGVEDLLAASGMQRGVPFEQGVLGLSTRVGEMLTDGVPGLGAASARMVADCAPERVAERMLDAYRRSLQEPAR